MSENLNSTLSTLAKDVNDNAQVHRITRNWTVDINIECLDTDDRYRIQVIDGSVTNILRAPTETHSDGETILLRSDSECLDDIFSGRRNPALANIDGDLLVYGDERHSTRLDAIALILWGFH